MIEFLNKAIGLDKMLARLHGFEHDNGLAVSIQPGDGPGKHKVTIGKQTDKMGKFFAGWCSPQLSGAAETAMDLVEHVDLGNSSPSSASPAQSSS